MSNNSSYVKPASVPVTDLVLPPSMPLLGNRVSRWIGIKMMNLLGWQVGGTLPDSPRLIIAAAPHTSNWDFIHAMFLAMAVGVKFSYLMKKEAFFWPFKGLFMALGGIPIDRSRGDEVMEDMRQWFLENPQCWVALTPEGTRKKVEKFKTGFLRIAQAVDAPIMLVAWHYPTKTTYFVEPPPLTGDVNEDADRIKHFFDQHFVGKNP